ncbi:MAG: amidohydrolase family protein, partial [Atribacterota bacterium]|nr:amidohydrolase family protein [Atribacterota bacterium]
TMSAAAGGITTIIDMPCTSIPPVTNGSNFDYKLNIVKPKAYVDFAFWGGVTPEQVESGEYRKSIKELKDRGIIGVKFYTISGMELYPRMSISNMDKAFRLMKELNLVCAIHAEDYYLVDYYSHLMQEMRREDPESWSEGRVYEAEPEAIWSVVGITEKVGNKLHIVHLSTKEGLNVIRWAKTQGLNVSTETCPQYLVFTTEDFKKMGSILKIAPPLRKEEDREELWKGLKDGSIDFICTDHAAGKYPEEKSSPNIWKNYAGIPGIQLVVPTMLHYGYHQGRLTLSEIQKLMSENAAKRYGFYPQKGIIKVGCDADFTIVDLDKKWVVEPSKLESKGKYSPLTGKELTGQIYMTIVRGEVVYRADKGIIGAKGYGKLI